MEAYEKLVLELVLFESTDVITDESDVEGPALG